MIFGGSERRRLAAGFVEISRVCGKAAVPIEMVATIVNETEVTKKVGGGGRDVGMKGRAWCDMRRLQLILRRLLFKSNIT